MANYQLSHTGAKIDEAIGKALTALQTMPKHTHSVDDITGLNNTSSASVAYNLLDNSNFLNPINQRNSTEYSATGYTVDRWHSNGALAVTLGADGLVFANNAASTQSIEQRIPLEKLKTGATYTAAVKTTDGEIYCGSCELTTDDTTVINPAAFYIKLGIGASYGFFTLHVRANQSLSVEWLALYEGEYTADNLPTYMVKGYAEELHECMRYYIRIPTTAQLTIIGYAYSATAARFSVPVGIQMRSAPELSFGNLSSCRIYPGAITPTGIGGRAVVGPMVTFALTAASTSGLKADDMIVLRPGTMMEFSADL